MDRWVASYQAEAAISREITAGRKLDAACARPDLADRNLRWVLLHLIEETAQAGVTSGRRGRRSGRGAGMLLS